MRDMLQKTTTENKRHNYSPRPLGPGLNSIYHEISQNNENYRLKMTDDNELRMDLYIREHAPQTLQGRYSYCPSSGWTKTNKELCSHQMDFLMSENYYRMAVNKEVEEKPHPKLLNELADYCKATTRPFDIRLKRSMRVLKENVYEISLSEIYTINSLEVCQAVGELIFHPTNLENYMRKKFINFYTFAEGYSERVAWEIELELQKTLNFTLRELVLGNRIL